jgi:hypothetical protein
MDQRDDDMTFAVRCVSRPTCVRQARVMTRMNLYKLVYIHGSIDSPRYNIRHLLEFLVGKFDTAIDHGNGIRGFRDLSQEQVLETQVVKVAGVDVNHHGHT